MTRVTAAMSAQAQSPDAPDARALARHARRLAAQRAPWLHAEVARRMAERLPMIKRAPARVIDWGAAAGAGGELLRAAYPRAKHLAVEDDVAAAAAAQLEAGRPGARARWWPWRGARSAGAMPASRVPEGACELLWSNMSLHRAPDVAALFAAWRRALVVDGFLMFSTLGPGTLAGLREIYARSRWPSPHMPFIDMHDLGDLLVRAGFADPVMDQERLTLTWSDASKLVCELRQLGGNTDPRRFCGLRTPRWRARLEAALAERADASGRIGLEFEVVYGHAFCPPPRAKVEPETELSLQQMRNMLRAPRTPPTPVTPRNPEDPKASRGSRIALLRGLESARFFSPAPAHGP
jgi:malonyl-CoA O-methyltransferase